MIYQRFGRFTILLTYLTIVGAEPTRLPFYLKQRHLPQTPIIPNDYKTHNATFPADTEPLIINVAEPLLEKDCAPVTVYKQSQILLSESPINDTYSPTVLTIQPPPPLPPPPPSLSETFSLPISSPSIPCPHRHIAKVEPLVHYPSAIPSLLSPPLLPPLPLSAPCPPQSPTIPIVIGFREDPKHYVIPPPPSPPPPPSSLSSLKLSPVPEPVSFTPSPLVVKETFVAPPSPPPPPPPPSPLFVQLAPVPKPIQVAPLPAVSQATFVPQPPPPPPSPPLPSTLKLASVPAPVPIAPLPAAIETAFIPPPPAPIAVKAEDCFEKVPVAVPQIIESKSEVLVRPAEPSLSLPSPPPPPPPALPLPVFIPDEPLPSLPERKIIVQESRPVPSPAKVFISASPVSSFLPPPPPPRPEFSISQPLPSFPEKNVLIGEDIVPSSPQHAPVAPLPPLPQSLKPIILASIVVGSPPQPILLADDCKVDVSPIIPLEQQNKIIYPFERNEILLPSLYKKRNSD